jgi:hypothetical protein
LSRLLPGLERGWKRLHRERLESSTFPDLLKALRELGIATDPRNQITAAQAIGSKNPVLGYNASKKLSEEAAWQFMEEKKPVFDLAVINPDIIIGPMLQPIRGPESVNETNNFAIFNFLNGTYKQIDSITFPFYHVVSSKPHKSSTEPKTEPLTTDPRTFPGRRPRCCTRPHHRSNPARRLRETHPPRLGANHAPARHQHHPPPLP